MAIDAIIIAILLILPIVSLFVIKKKLATDKYTYEDKYMAYGIPLGLALGVSIGTALGNIAFGIGPGLALGVAMGAGLERKYGKKIKLTDELRVKKWNNTVIFMAGIIVVISILALILYLGY